MSIFESSTGKKLLKSLGINEDAHKKTPPPIYGTSSTTPPTPTPTPAPSKSIRGIQPGPVSRRSHGITIV